MGSKRYALAEIAEINAAQYSPKEKWPLIQYLDTGSVTRGQIDALQQLVPGIDKIPGRARRKVKNGSIVYSMVRPNQEHYALLANPPANMLASTGFAVIDAKTDVVTPEYLYYALIHPDTTAYFQALAEQVVSTYPTLGKDDLARYEINVPDLSEQRAIATLLGSFDEMIVINQQTNGYLLQLTKLQLKDYLSRAKDTPLVSVGDYVGSMSNGATPSRKNAAFWDDGNIPWVKTGEVNNGLILKTEEHVTRLALEKTSIKLLPVDTVIMALYGSGTAGRLGILQIEATTNQACTAMVCKSSIEAFYLFVTLQGMYRQIDNMTRGSVQQNLSKDLVAKIQIPRIPKQVLEEMGLAEYYAQIAVNMRESDGLASIRDALLPKLMSGEVDVSQIELPTQPNSHLRER